MFRTSGCQHKKAAWISGSFPNHKKKKCDSILTNDIAFSVLQNRALGCTWNPLQQGFLNAAFR